MYKDLKKVYVRKLDDIINPTDNMLYITEDTGKTYIWDGITSKLKELSGSDNIIADLKSQIINLENRVTALEK